MVASTISPHGDRHVEQPPAWTGRMVPMALNLSRKASQTMLRDAAKSQQAPRLSAEMMEKMDHMDCRPGPGNVGIQIPPYLAEMIAARKAAQGR